jgi:hypothetical protein
MEPVNFSRKPRLKRLRHSYENLFRRITERIAHNYLNKNGEFKDLLKEVKKQSSSLGLSDFEYVKLYQMVRKIKPEYALECGTGKSTFIIAHAMCKNGNAKKLVTLEESKEWAEQQRKTVSHLFNHKKANEWFPGEPEQLVELINSETAITSYRIWRGSYYKNISDYPYTFMMVDGPRLNDDCFLNLDLINILQKSENSISIWIDGRWAILAMCRALFGSKVISKIGWTHTEIYNASKDDLLKPRTSMKEIRRMAKGF